MTTGPVRADRYTCPQCDHVWYRPDIGTPVASPASAEETPDA